MTTFLVRRALLALAFSCVSFVHARAAAQASEVVLLASEADGAALAGALALELGTGGVTLHVVVAPAGGDAVVRATAEMLVAADPSVAVVLVERDAETPRLRVLGARGERSTPLPDATDGSSPRITAMIAASLVLELRGAPVLTVVAATVPPPPATPTPPTPTPATAVVEEPTEEPPPGRRVVSLYAQIGAGISLRERADAVDPTFVHRVSLGLEILGIFRIAALVMMPAFNEEVILDTGPIVEASLSYFGGLELGHRAQLDALALHAGVLVAGGMGLVYDVAEPPSGAPSISEAPALYAAAYGAIGAAITGNTDLLVRAELGIRARDLDPAIHPNANAELVAQLLLGVDWH